MLATYSRTVTRIRKPSTTVSEVKHKGMVKGAQANSCKLGIGASGLGAKASAKWLAAAGFSPRPFFGAWARATGGLCDGTPPESIVLRFNMMRIPRTRFGSEPQTLSPFS